jgi:hypothetical protein
MADGKVEQDEVYELQLAIERVVPKDVREELKEKRRIAYYNSPATENQLEYLRRLGVNPRSEISRSTASELIDETLRQAPATERQLNYIRDLGGNVPPEMSKRQASELIDELLEQEARQGPTHRQMMVLRFWNRLDMAHSSKDEITDWLSRFYKEDPRRKAAWDIFKVDSGDAGLQGDPSFVPLGAGEEYLQALRGVFPTS